MTVPAAFESRLAPFLTQYVNWKRALGRRFDRTTRTLQSLDRLLHEQAAQYPDLNATAFQAWCRTLEDLASGVRRDRMRVVYNFCLYRRRTEPRCFVPDPALFPKRHQSIRPYIFSEHDVARLLLAASGLKRGPRSPLRPEMIRLAIVLLFTTGVRCGELLRLTLGDYNRRDATLLIRESKFHKSRLLPINNHIADEIERSVRTRAQWKLPVSSDTAFIWNASKGGKAIQELEPAMLSPASPSRMFHLHPEAAAATDTRFSSACRLPDYADSSQVGFFLRSFGAEVCDVPTSCHSA